MRKWFAAVTVAVALIGAACGSSNNNKATTSTVKSSSAVTYTVNVDNKSSDFTFFATAYFPDKLTVHPGDTVDFNEVFSGEPHTVTLGTLVDKGLAAAKAAGPAAQDEPAELQKLPPLLPQGPGDANQMAANPCFLATGDPPTDKACPKATQPDFDGTQSVLNSGFLEDGDSFKVKLANSIKPGTYSFFCLLHRGGMTGEITVVDKTAKAQTAAEVNAAGQKKLDDLVAKLKPQVPLLEKGQFPPLVTSPKPTDVLAGSGEPSIANAGIAQFGPKEVSVPVGGSVTWVILGPHTISFKSSESVASSVITKGPDGAYHANEAALAPVGGPGAPPPAAPTDPNAAPPPPRITDGGTWDGAAPHSSGIFVSGPPALDGYKLKFSKAGTYPYKCLVHPKMEGTVKVG